MTDKERVHFLQHLLNGDCDLPDPWKYLDLEAWNIASLAGISVSLKQHEVVLESLHDFYLLLSVTSYNSTVNPEIFARVIFSGNFAFAEFRENKTLAIWRNHSVVY